MDLGIEMSTSHASKRMAGGLPFEMAAE